MCRAYSCHSLFLSPKKNQSLDSTTNKSGGCGSNICIRKQNLGGGFLVNLSGPGRKLPAARVAEGMSGAGDAAPPLLRVNPLRTRAAQYDAIALIDQVAARPALWDRTIRSDKLMRRALWREICSGLDEGYDQASDAEKGSIEDTITGRWINIRDAFIRTIKKKSKKKYYYHDQLEFLLKNIDSDFVKLQNLFSQHDDQYLSQEPQNQSFESIESTEDRVKLPKKPKARKKRPHDDSSENFMDPRPMFTDPSENFMDQRPMFTNEDEAFFASLLPTVSRFNEDEKILFRIEVLKTIQQMKRSRPCYQQPSQSPCSSDNDTNCYNIM